MNTTSDYEEHDLASDWRKYDISLYFFCENVTSC